MRASGATLAVATSASFLFALALGPASSVRGEPGPSPAKAWPGRAAAEGLVKKHKLEDEYKHYLHDLEFMTDACKKSTDESLKGPRVLTVVERIQRDPLSAVDECNAITDPIEAAGAKDDVPAMLLQLATAIDLKPGPVKTLERPGDAAKLEDWLQYFEDTLVEVKRLRDLAFEKVKPEDQRALARDVRILFDVLKQTFYIEGRPAVLDRSLNAIRRASDVDLAKLVEASVVATTLCKKDTLEKLRAFLSKLKVPTPHPTHAGCEGDLLAVKSTPVGDIIIGGTGKNKYDCKAANAALIVDAGGDDTYVDAASIAFDGPDDAPLPSFVSMVIDLDGNDTYTVSEGQECSEGGACLGVSVLCDLKGNDTYKGGRFSQGAGFMGVGVLIDYDGNDQYTATEFSQGAGGFGIGLLYDAKGDDRYETALMSQGAGFQWGAGCLYDRLGNDKTKCTGVYPSTYGTAGEFHAMGQGVGMGFRGLPDGKADFGGGGIGILLKTDGNAEYDAGEFGLGCGYWFGLGLVRTTKGNDQYRSSRYGLGTGAHLGIGVVIDMDGDDHYSGRSVANQAGTWDGTIGVLYDAKGTDVFECSQGLCHGAAVWTGFSILYSGGSNVTFKSGGGESQGEGGNANDAERNSISFGFLIHEGPKKSVASYTRGTGEQRKPGTESVYVKKEKEAIVGYGLFLDR